MTMSESLKCPNCDHVAPADEFTAEASAADDMICDDCGWQGSEDETERVWLEHKADFLWICPECGGMCGPL